MEKIEKSERYSLKTTNNLLLKRQEINFIIKSDKTPTFQDAVKIVSEQAKKPEENIYVSKIAGKFGRKSFLVTAYAYESKEDREKMHHVKEKKAKTGTEQEEKK